MKVQEADRLGNIKTYYFAKKLAEIADLNSSRSEQVINLGIGSPDLLPPKEVIEALNEASKSQDAHKYQSYRGIPELRHSFTRWYESHFDVNLNADKEVLPLMGSKEGIMHISMSLLNPGDEVLVPNPGYPAYRMTASLAGANVIFYDLHEERGWLPDLDHLASKDLSKVKIMWVNYPHMPTGSKADLSFFKRLVQFADKHNILICHDNPYVFILNNDPLSIMQAEGAKSCCIELVSLSKCYNMAGWRIGALVGHENAINAILKFKSNMDSGMFKPLQIAAAKALSMDEQWMESLDEIYGRRKLIAHQIMDELGATYEKDSAGLFVWGNVSAHNISVENFCDKILYEANVFITPGHIFGDNGEGYIRISLCSSEEVLCEGLNRLRSLKWGK